MKADSQSSASNTRGTRAGSRTAPPLPSDVASLIPERERMWKMHPDFPQFCYDMIRVAAARSRRSMVDIVRDEMIRWAEEYRARLEEELAREQQGER